MTIYRRQVVDFWPASSRATKSQAVRKGARGMRVIEQGPSIGQYDERPIPAFIVRDDGRRMEFDRIATVDADGGALMSQLDAREAMISPGLIYRPVT